MSLLDSCLFLVCDNECVYDTSAGVQVHIYIVSAIYCNIVTCITEDVLVIDIQIIVILNTVLKF